MTPATPPAARIVVAVVTALVLVATGCGSQLDPQDVVRSAGTAGPAVSDGGGPVAADDGAVVAPDGSGADPGGGDVAGAPPVDTGGTAVDPGAPPVDGATDDDGGEPATPVTPNKPCTLKNQRGITDDEVLIANASDISGPVPGLFQSARDGTAAFVAYFNSTDDLCGRKLRMLDLDSRTDAGADQAAYAEACDKAFAAVGSTSIFDLGGARLAEQCGLPDVRALSLSPERSKCRTCYSAQAQEIGVAATYTYETIKKLHPGVEKNAAFFYLNIGGSPGLAKSFSEAATSVGYNVEILQGIETSDFNYVPYVQGLKDKGTTFVYFVGATLQAVRLRQVMAQQGYEPEAFVVTQTQYTSDYVETGGSEVDGTYLSLAHPLFEGNPPPRRTDLPHLARPRQPRRDADVVRPVRLVGRPTVRRERRGARLPPHPRDAPPGVVEGERLDGGHPALTHGGRPQGHLQVRDHRPAPRRNLAQGLAGRLRLRRPRADLGRAVGRRTDGRVGARYWRGGSTPQRAPSSIGRAEDF